MGEESCQSFINESVSKVGSKPTFGNDEIPSSPYICNYC